MDFCEIHLLFCWYSSYPIFGMEESFTLVPLCSQLCQVNGNCYPPGKDFHSTRSSSPEVNPTPWFKVTTESHNSHTFTVKQCFTHSEKRQSKVSFKSGHWFPMASRSPPTSDTIDDLQGPLLCAGWRTLFLPLHSTTPMKECRSGWQGAVWYTRSKRTEEHVLSLERERCSHEGWEGSLWLGSKEVFQAQGPFLCGWVRSQKTAHSFAFPSKLYFLAQQNRLDHLDASCSRHGSRYSSKVSCLLFVFFF